MEICHLITMSFWFKITEKMFEGEWVDLRITGEQGGSVVKNTLDYLSRVPGLIPRFSSLSDETVNRGFSSI